MNIKFYLLSQEFAAGDTFVGGEGGMWWEGAGDGKGLGMGRGWGWGFGGHDVATTCSLQTTAHFAGTPP